MSDNRISPSLAKPRAARAVFGRPAKASPVSRENEEQRLVESYLKRLDDGTLDRLGYSAEQIDRLRRGRSVRLSA